MAQKPSIANFLPKGTKVLLTGSGRQFIERIGVEAARKVVAGVLTGENIRDQTEPLTRLRVAQVTGGIVAFFAHAKAAIPDFDRSCLSSRWTNFKPRTATTKQKSGPPNG